MTKKCPGCSRELPLELFADRPERKSGKQSYCRECNRRKSQEFYRKNRSRIRAGQARSRAAAKEMLLELLTGKVCKDCGEGDVLVLEFDHVRGTKRKAVSRMVSDGYGLETIRVEIEKCDVVCANCHRRRTHKGSWRDVSSKAEQPVFTRSG